MTSHRQVKFGYALLLVAVGLWLAGTAQAKTINVPANYNTIQAAINAAVTGDVVMVAPGTYLERIDFKGKAITVQGTNPSDKTVVAATIIDGSKKGTVVTFKSGERATSVLKGLTISNGCGTYGGGVYCDGSSPSLTRNVISGNSARGYSLYGEYFGGGVCCVHSASPILTYSTITGNTASNHGGGVYCAYGSPTLTGNTISDNTATGVHTAAGDSGGTGGGVYCEYSSPTLSHNTISGNSAKARAGSGGSASGYGGGIYCYSGSPTLTANTLRHNAASSVGGAFYYAGGGGDCNATLTQNLIASNTAGSGGGVYLGRGEITLTDNTITDNTAAGDGGGVLCEDAWPTIAHNAIGGNSAVNGGGIALIQCDGVPFRISHNTIRDNSASAVGGYGGGGIYSQVSYPVIEGNTISGNRADGWGGGGLLAFDGGPNTSPDLLRNRFIGNTASWDGGGVLWHASDAEVLDNTFAGNSAGRGGGGMSVFGSSWSGEPFTVSGNTFHANSAGSWGGGVDWWYDSSGVLSNNEIIGNDVSAADGQGGGVCVGAGEEYDMTRRLLNNTICANSAALGGGIFCGDGMGLVLTNCVVALNPTGGGLCIEPNDGVFYPQVPIIAYCNFYNNTGGNYVNWPNQTGKNGNICKNPLFANAAKGDFHEKSKGGRWNPGTKTWVIDTVHSPCIDKGDPTSAYALEPTPNGKRVNMGAYGNTKFASKSAPAVPAGGLMVSAAAAPTAGGGAQLSVNLSAAASVEVTLLNLAGRPLAALPTSDLPEGVSTLLWSGKSATGLRVPAGTYLARLTARTEDGKQCQALVAVTVQR